MLQQPAWTRLMPERWVLAVARLGPLGTWRAPGTWGSLAGLVWYTAACLPAGWFGSLLLTAAGLYLAFALCGEAEIRLHKVDPGEVILDEFAAMPLTVIGFGDIIATPRAWVVFVGAFLLFRLFDIAKPLGIARLQRFRGGLGVLLDDVAAALAACAVLQLVLRLTPLLAWLTPSAAVAAGSG